MDVQTDDVSNPNGGFLEVGDLYHGEVTEGAGNTDSGVTWLDATRSMLLCCRCFLVNQSIVIVKRCLWFKHSMPELILLKFKRVLTSELC